MWLFAGNSVSWTRFGVCTAAIPANKSGGSTLGTTVFGMGIAWVLH